MGKKKKTDDAAEAPYGWDVIGLSDGRRISRGVSRTEAEEVAARVAANSNETTEIVPSEARDLGDGRTMADIVASPPAEDAGEKEPPPDEPEA